MEYPHRIRLRGPWELTFAGEASARRVTMPCHFDSPVTAQCLRRFGYPGRIDAFEKVWLVVDALRGPATVKLNEHLLSETASGDFRADVTSLLADRNRLDISLIDAVGQPWSEAALEVTAAAWLEDIRWEPTQVTGKIAGDWPEPMDLYVLLDGRHVGYEGPRGTGPFAVKVDGAGSVLCVDLIWGATRFHRVQLTES